MNTTIVWTIRVIYVFAMWMLLAAIAQSLDSNMLAKHSINLYSRNAGVHCGFCDQKIFLDNALFPPDIEFKRRYLQAMATASNIMPGDVVDIATIDQGVSNLNDARAVAVWKAAAIESLLARKDLSDETVSALQTIERN